MLAFLQHAGNSSNLADLEAGLAGECTDLRPDAVDVLRFPGNHVLPATGGELRHTDDPVRVEFGAVVVLEEILASDVVTRRKAYQAALTAHEAPVDLVVLLNQRIDTRLVEAQ